MNKDLEKRFEELEKIAKDFGVDPFPVIYEEVPREVIWDTSSYGLPIRMSHWTFGRSYVHQKAYGEMGISKIYELIVNNNPSLALLDETNSDTTNLLICAHCMGHSDFFKNNALFRPTNRNMITQAEQNAKIVEGYKESYGIDAVEEVMDIGFALDGHIDPWLGEHRQKYPEPELVFEKRKALPYADLFGEDSKPQVVQTIKNTGFPPHPEKDLLWFLINYSKLLPWQREVLSLIRSEAFYFYPQGQTKIMNEGWASFWHAEILLNYWAMTPAEHMDFAIAHSKIVCPGYNGSLNPYYIGFRIFGDIRKRWDKFYEEGKKDPAFQASPLEEAVDEKGRVVKSKLNGMQKMFRVRAEEDDISFIGNYLTLELAEEMNLYVYGQDGNSPDPDDDDIVIKSRKLEEIKQSLVGRLHNNGLPPIVIVGADESGLYLRHEKADKLTLDRKYAAETLRYMFRIWKRPILLETRDEDDEPLTFEVKQGTVKVGERDGTITEIK